MRIDNKQITNFNLSGLTDTNLTGVTDVDVMSFNATSTKWESTETIDLDSAALSSTTIPTKFSIVTGFTADSTLTISHDLNSTSIVAQVWDSLNVLTGVDISLFSGDTSNKINVTSSVSGTFRVVVIG